MVDVTGRPGHPEPAAGAGGGGPRRLLRAAGAWLFPAGLEARARRDRVLRVLFALLAVVLVARATHKSVGILVHNQEWGERFLARQDPYYEVEIDRRIHAPYPPSLALVAVPLALLPTLVARALWASLQVGALLLFYRLLRGRLRRHWPAVAPHAPAVFALGLLLISRFLLRDTAGGGGNLIYTLLAFGGVELALLGRERLGAVPLALSLVLKPNLLPLTLFLALRKRWRALGTTLVAGALLFALPGLWFGPRAYLDLTTRWVSDVVAYGELEDLHSRELVPDGMPAAEDGRNQSLREAVHRLLRPPGDSGAEDVHVVTASPAVAAWIARGLSFVALLVVCAGAWRARGEKGEWLAALAFLPLAMLLSPVTWKGHHVDLLLCLSALVAVALAERRIGRWLGPALFGYWVVCDLLSLEVVGPVWRDYLQAASVVTWADIALLGLLVWLAARREVRS